MEVDEEAGRDEWLGAVTSTVTGQIVSSKCCRGCAALPGSPLSECCTLLNSETFTRNRRRTRQPWPNKMRTMVYNESTFGDMLRDTTRNAHENELTTPGHGASCSAVAAYTRNDARARYAATGAGSPIPSAPNR